MNIYSDFWQATKGLPPTKAIKLLEETLVWLEADDTAAEITAIIHGSKKWPDGLKGLVVDAYNYDNPPCDIKSQLEQLLFSRCEEAQDKGLQFHRSDFVRRVQMHWFAVHHMAHQRGLVEHHHGRVNYYGRGHALYEEMERMLA